MNFQNFKHTPLLYTRTDIHTNRVYTRTHAEQQGRKSGERNEGGERLITERFCAREMGGEITTERENESIRE